MTTATIYATAADGSAVTVVVPLPASLVSAYAQGGGAGDLMGFARAVSVNGVFDESGTTFYPAVSVRKIVFS